jgi:FAD dependent monooxygenase
LLSFGLPLAFLERQKLLQILYDSLPDTSKVLTDKTVISVDCSTGARCIVRTEEGGVYQGDLVVGADGVHSQVRGQMWALADTLEPGLISDREKQGQ